MERDVSGALVPVIEPEVPKCAPQVRRRRDANADSGTDRADPELR